MRVVIILRALKHFFLLHLQSYSTVLQLHRLLSIHPWPSSILYFHFMLGQLLKIEWCEHRSGIASHIAWTVATTSGRCGGGIEKFFRSTKFFFTIFARCDAAVVVSMCTSQYPSPIGGLSELKENNASERIAWHRTPNGKWRHLCENSSRARRRFKTRKYSICIHVLVHIWKMCGTGQLTLE